MVCDRCKHLPIFIDVAVQHRRNLNTPVRARLCKPCWHELVRFLGGSPTSGVMREGEGKGRVPGVGKATDTSNRA